MRMKCSPSSLSFSVTSWRSSSCFFIKTDSSVKVMEMFSSAPASDWKEIKMHEYQCDTCRIPRKHCRTKSNKKNMCMWKWNMKPEDKNQKCVLCELSRSWSFRISDVKWYVGSVNTGKICNGINEFIWWWLWWHLKKNKIKTESAKYIVTISGDI